MHEARAFENPLNRVLQGKLVVHDPVKCTDVFIHISKLTVEVLQVLLYFVPLLSITLDYQFLYCISSEILTCNTSAKERSCGKIVSVLLA